MTREDAGALEVVFDHGDFMNSSLSGREKVDGEEP
jgi:hypothetical protein